MTRKTGISDILCLIYRNKSVFPYFYNLFHFLIFSGNASSPSAVNLTQVPQEELKLLGTGITTAFSPFFSHARLKVIAPKCEQKVAIYSSIIFSDESGNLLPAPLPLLYIPGAVQNVIRFLLQSHYLPESHKQLPYFPELSLLNIVARMNDLESIKKSIVNGLGISILSARSVQNLEQTKQILVFSLEESQSKRLFYIAYSRHRILTRREQEISPLL